MKRIVLRLAAFWMPVALVVGMYLRFAPHLLETHFGPNTSLQIERSFAQAKSSRYSALLLGNSRIYRGVNPALLPVPTYNFAGDAESFNQMYFKLKWLEEQGKSISLLLMGADYFQFSTMVANRNTIYARYFPGAYLEDYHETRSLETRFNESMTTIFTSPTSNLLSVAFQQLRGTGGPISFLRENGQYVVTTGRARPTDVSTATIERLAVQERYFHKIIEHCRERHVRIVLILMPSRPCELENYTQAQIREFHDFVRRSCSGADVWLLNYSKCPEFEIDDYMDVTHLRPDAADRFSEIFGRDVAELLRRRDGGEVFDRDAGGSQSPEILASGGELLLLR